MSLKLISVLAQPKRPREEVSVDEFADHNDRIEPQTHTCF
jgi:hypothetical protein